MRLQLDVSYGIGLPVFMIGIATVVLSAAALSREVETRRTQLLVTKPIASWQIFAGKLLGVLVVVGVLLVAVLGVFAVNVSLVARGEGTDARDLERVNRAFFTVRDSVSVLHPHDPAAEAEAGRVEPGRHDKGPHARRVNWLRARPGESLTLTFSRIPTSSVDNELLRVIYRIYSADPQGAPRLKVVWSVRPHGPGEKAVVPIEEEALHGTPQELYLPATAVSPEGELRLQLHNSMPADSGLLLHLNPARVEVLSVCGHFWPNVLRAFLLIFGQLLLLSSLCLLGSALFAFPTVTFLGLFLYLTALTSGFLQETFDLYASVGHSHNALEMIAERMAIVGTHVLGVLPDFARLDPLGRLWSGRVLSVGELLHVLVWPVGVNSIAALGVAACLFRRRELGKN